MNKKIPKAIRHNLRLLKQEFDFIHKWKSVSFFYITDTASRSRRIQFIQDNGAITRKFERNHGGFPVCIFETDEKKMNEILNQAKKENADEYENERGD